MRKTKVFEKQFKRLYLIKAKTNKRVKIDMLKAILTIFTSTKPYKNDQSRAPRIL